MMYRQLYSVLLSNSTSGYVRLLSSRILARFASLLATVPVINRLDQDLALSSQTKLIESWVTQWSDNGEKFSKTSDLIYLVTVLFDLLELSFSSK